MKSIFNWSEVLETSEHCPHYTHVWAKVGDDIVVINWKSWKHIADSAVLEINGEFIESLNYTLRDGSSFLMKEAKLEAEEIYAKIRFRGISERQISKAFLSSQISVTMKLDDDETGNSCTFSMPENSGFVYYTPENDNFHVYKYTDDFWSPSGTIVATFSGCYIGYDNSTCRDRMSYYMKRAVLEAFVDNFQSQITSIASQVK